MKRMDEPRTPSTPTAHRVSSLRLAGFAAAAVTLLLAAAMPGAALLSGSAGGSVAGLADVGADLAIQSGIDPNVHAEALAALDAAQAQLAQARAELEAAHAELATAEARLDAHAQLVDAARAETETHASASDIVGRLQGACGRFSAELSAMAPNASVAFAADVQEICALADIHVDAVASARAAVEAAQASVEEAEVSVEAHASSVPMEEEAPAEQASTAGLKGFALKLWIGFKGLF